MSESRRRSDLAVSAAILVGGQSARFGADKALARFSETGPTVLERVVGATRAVSDDVFLIGPARPGYEASGAPIIPDGYPGEGPLGGLLTAAQRARYDRIFLTGCDLPFLNPRLVTWLAGFAGEGHVIPNVPDPDDPGGRQRFQFLHAIYWRPALAPLGPLLTQGDRRMSATLTAPGLVIPPLEGISDHDPGFWSFFGINTRRAFEIAREHWQDACPAGSG